MDMRKYTAGVVWPDDVRDGPMQMKIVDVSISDRFDAPVLHFENGDTLMLSPPNSRTMGRAYTTKSEMWLNQVVELSLGHYTDNKTGMEKETVTLKPISVLQPSADNGGAKAAPGLPSPSPRNDPDDEIAF